MAKPADGMKVMLVCKNLETGVPILVKGLLQGQKLMGVVFIMLLLLLVIVLVL